MSDKNPHETITIKRQMAVHILFIVCLYILTIVILYPLVPSIFNIPTAPGVATVTELTSYMQKLLVAFNLFIPYHLWKIFELLAKLFFFDRDKVEMQKIDEQTK